MKRVYIVIAVVAVLGWVALGLIIAKGPKPEILVPAEIITKVGPVNISNTMIASWLAMIFLIVASFLATRTMRLMPSGFQNFVEAVIEFLLDQIESIAGQERGRKFFALVATIFIFIVVSNWMGLLPFFNAIGKTEDVGHEVFHEISLHEEEGHDFEEREKFAGVKMEDSSWVVWAKPQSGAEEFEIEAGDSPETALDRYIVFLATVFTDFEVQAHEGEHAAPSAADVEAAAAALAADPSAPQLLMGEHGEGEHGVASGALGGEVTGIDFPDRKLVLVVPFFRSPFSDVNNTLALALISFVVVEFWGLQTLGIGYLSRFFNLQGIGTFVGLLELLSEFIRIISFAFRLFGNIFAGEVLILILTFLLPFLFVDIIYGLELFVGFIQAAVFALLTLVFAVMATEAHGDEHHEDGGDHESPAAEGATQA